MIGSFLDGLTGSVWLALRPTTINPTSKVDNPGSQMCSIMVGGCKHVLNGDTQLAVQR